MIYDVNKEGMPESIGNECISNDVEGKFVDELCEEIMKALSISYNEQRIIRPLLVNTVGKKVNDHYKNKGLLQQYKAHCLDKASERLIKEFCLISTVNHDNADHAKFANIVKELKVKLEPEPCKSPSVNK